MTAPVFQDITGIILVGGKSRRMGQDKALLSVQGKTLIERALEPFQQSFEQVLLIGDRPERFAAFRLPVVPDLYPGSSLGGLYTGLFHARTEHIFVTSCDLPFPNPAILQYLCHLRDGYDAVIPCSSQGSEPLFACYRKSCLDAMGTQLQEGRFSINAVCSRLHIRQVPYRDLAPFDPAGTSFLNLNTPEDIALLS